MTISFRPGSNKLVSWAQVVDPIALPALLALTSGLLDCAGALYGAHLMDDDPYPPAARAAIRRTRSALSPDVEGKPCSSC